LRFFAHSYNRFLNRIALPLSRILAAALTLIVAAQSALADDRADREFFESKIRPVLVQECYRCHSPEAGRPKANLRLDTPEGLRKGGDNGPPVVPGKPDESLLIQAIAQSGETASMPPKKKLAEGVVRDFRKWVESGAHDPREANSAAGARPPLKSLDWWSLKPIQRRALPPVDRAGENWIRTPIDRFVLAKLKEKGLSPAPEADRRALIRRLSFDLTGLPPTPEEIVAFLDDQSIGAYERLADRLLASPHHGERLARHWMDLVHFAETHGHDQDRIRPNAWRYRDYLIESFNRDVPYAQFVREQLAADVFYPDEPRLAVGLGFIAAGPWDESSLRDIRDDSIDRQIGYYLDRDDMVSTTMSTFVSSTVHCARCHDHKFDPIGQAEYYNLQAVFAGVDRADRAYDPDPAIARRRRELTARQKALQARDPELLASLLEPEFQAVVNRWESSQKDRLPTWTVLDPETFEAVGGSTLTKEVDRSVYSSGKRPDQEIYTISAKTDLRHITAIRLEVLPDDRLPSKGPGRNENGNLHLTEFTILAASQADPTHQRYIRVGSSVADFDQSGWPITAAIDGNPQTAWGIYPQVGKPHQAVFELAEDLTEPSGLILNFTLVQSHPATHPIGRLRVSVTNATRPVRISTLPDSIAAIHALPADKRTTTQCQDLAVFVLAKNIGQELQALPAPQFVFAGAAEFAPDAGHKPPGGPRPVHLLRRGDIHQPGSLAHAGTLSCVAGLPGQFSIADTNDEAARRAALADWIVDSANVLTWRSIVNRVWQFHFGRGIVDSLNDFGRMGATPSHPELLDWLAAEFRDSGGSIKHLERLIVTSAVYRQDSRHDARSAAIDADNYCLWRQNRRRLDAESVHDAILLASGALDRTMGGPSVQQFALSPGVHVTPVVDYTRYDWTKLGSARRSVYRFLFRTLPDPFMDSLDAADASQLTPTRGESLTPLQALALLNNPFVLRYADALGQRLEQTNPNNHDAIRDLFVRALGRPPNASESQEWSQFASRRGFAAAARLLFNSNEFLFVN
jgi:hypothetical protein